MKQFLLLLFTFLSVKSFAQTDYDTSVDKENGAIVYQGQFTFDDLSREPTFSWFRSGTDAYQPDPGQVAKLAAPLKDYRLVVLLGTWCDDSQNLVPKLYKTLQEANYPLASVTLIGVNRAKETKSRDQKVYDLQRVPTIIIYKAEKEIGRIVETAERTIEKDMAVLIGIQ